ncbi:MAG: hypothetical protein Q9164_000524 [Protoblastenia rupestris]
MSGPVAELDGILQSMLSLKPPGVTGGKISSVTTLCNTHIQFETVLIQRIYTHFKKAPSTHKLGVLYVVDSVTRGWVEQARKAGQALGPSERPTDGTFAAGHKRVTELLPSFMNDIINTAPEDQKARITKLIDIWERSGTFAPDMLSSFRQKLAAPPTKATRTTTPPGSPPKDFIPLNENGNSGTMPAQPQNTSSILQALANIAKTNASMPGQPSQAGPGNMQNVQNPYTQNMPPSVNAAATMPPFTQAVSAMGAVNGANPYGAMSSTPNFSQTLPQMQGGQINAPQANPMPQGGAPTPEQLQQQVQIIQMLQAQGVPQDQWAAVLSALMAAGAGGANAAAAAPQQNWGQTQYSGRDDTSRDRTGYSDPYGMRSPSGRHRRSRSRSPSGYDRRRDASPRRRRDSPTYGAYGRGGDDRSSRGGNPYRQRSPDRYQRSDSPNGRDQTIPPPGPKNIIWDHSLPSDHIKVLSRTLFVGGVTSSDDTLRKIFEAFGTVQTCIVNVDKRHAFVKMITRQDAITAKEGMERYRNQEMQLRTRWGVGFGPRDCSDYSTGVSVIPLHKLTDADRKWMLTAEYGGTGGKNLEGGMVIEEPDIEIGAGVSSKAISRRMATDKGGQQGPRSSRDPPNQQTQNDSYRQPPRDNPNHHQQSNNNSIGVGPAVPGFGFNLPQMQNGFQFPPGFVFPGMTQAPGQPPPPGAS